MNASMNASTKDGGLLGSRIAGGNTAYSRSMSDFYPTPPECTIALLDHLRIPSGTLVWEPACGEGHIVDVLLDRGYIVRASDIKDGEDFLFSSDLGGAEWIITNPPFSLAEEFIRKSWDYGVPFALLLKAQFWNAKRRYGLFQDCPPSEVLPLTWRPDFLFKTRGSGSPLMDVCWVVWRSLDYTHETIYRPLPRPEIG